MSGIWWDTLTVGPSFNKHLVHRHSRGRCRLKVRGIGCVEVRNGSSDVAVFQQVFRQRQFDFHDFPQWASVELSYSSILQRGNQPLIIDLGANNGASALWFASTFPAAKIIAVEPEPESSTLCRDNTRDRDVETVTAAIGSRPGRVHLINGDDAWTVQTARAPAHETDRDEAGPDSAAVITIDEILQGHPDAELFIVKIDIEGFESDLFADNTKWVAAPKVIYLEPHDWMLPNRSSSATFQKVLGEHDFDLLIAAENLVYVRRDDTTLVLETEPRETSAS